MNKELKFGGNHFEMALRGVDSHYHQYLISLHEQLSEFPYLYENNDFLYGSSVEITIGGHIPLPCPTIPMNPSLKFSLAFCNPKTNISLEFVIRFEVVDASNVADKLESIDINIRKSGSPTGDGNISLNMYAKYRELKSAPELKKIDPNLSFESNLTHYLNVATPILEWPMKNIVNGVKWDPVSIDWIMGDYK
jgi:hypothetical protein